MAAPKKESSKGSVANLLPKAEINRTTGARTMIIAGQGMTELGSVIDAAVRVLDATLPMDKNALINIEKHADEVIAAFLNKQRLSEPTDTDAA